MSDVIDQATPAHTHTHGESHYLTHSPLDDRQDRGLRRVRRGRHAQRQRQVVGACWVSFHKQLRGGGETTRAVHIDPIPPHPSTQRAFDLQLSHPNDPPMKTPSRPSTWTISSRFSMACAVSIMASVAMRPLASPR